MKEKKYGLVLTSPRIIADYPVSNSNNSKAPKICKAFFKVLRKAVDENEHPCTVPREALKYKKKCRDLGPIFSD